MLAPARWDNYGMRFVIRALALWALVALVFWVAVAVIPGIDLPSFGAALLTTLAIALINALLWPIVIRIVLPITVITFGLAGPGAERGRRDAGRSSWSTATPRRS